MAAHTPASSESKEEFEFVPYEPSFLYPFCLSLTSAYMNFMPKVHLKIHQYRQFREEVVSHPTSRWLVAQEQKLAHDKDLRHAAIAGGSVFAVLAFTKKQPLVVAPLVGGTGAWIASLALFKPEVISDSLKGAYHWVYRHTRYLAGENKHK